jgi:hypothetical protein
MLVDSRIMWLSTTAGEALGLRGCSLRLVASGHAYAYGRLDGAQASNYHSYGIVLMVR